MGASVGGVLVGHTRQEGGQVAHTHGIFFLSTPRSLLRSAFLVFSRERGREGRGWGAASYPFPRPTLEVEPKKITHDLFRKVQTSVVNR